MAISQNHRQTSQIMHDVYVIVLLDTLFNVHIRSLHVDRCGRLQGVHVNGNAADSN